MHVTLPTISPGMFALLAILSAAQLALMVWAVIVLLRTPVQRLRLPQVVWIIIIVFVNVLGPIAFLLFGRKPVVVDIAPSAAKGSMADLVGKIYQ